MNELEIFVQARERPDRSNFLQEATKGDQELLTRVERLLELDLEANDIFDRDPQSILGELDPSHHSFSSLSSPHLVEDVCESLEMSTSEDSLGRLMHYEVIDLIGYGGFGFVLKATDTKLRRDVAIKILHRQFSESPEARDRFLVEARATASIRHDNTVQIYAVEEEPVPFLVMEHIEGTTLRKHIQDHAPLPIEEVLRLGIEIARGTEAAHTKDIVHRDIKPANIMLESGTKRAKVTDFGLAITSSDQISASPFGLAGTPSFMSPEQARGEAVDHLSDLFSIGSVLYLMCTGSSPFRARKRAAVINRVIKDEPEKISKLNPKVPKSLISVINRLHEKDPALRFQSAGEVVGALQACQRGLVPSIKSSAFSKVVAAAAACLIAVFASALYFNSRPERSAAKQAESRLSTTAPSEPVALSAIATLPARSEDPDTRIAISVPADRSAKGSQPSEPPSPSGKDRLEDFLAWMESNNKDFDREAVDARFSDERLVELNCKITDSYIPLEKLPNLERAAIYSMGVGHVDLRFAAQTRKLQTLTISGLEISSLGQLRGLPLKTLMMWGWRTPGNAKDGQLQPLTGLPLESLTCGCSMVRDLSPLQGMPLKTLCLNLTPVKSLEPLRGMPIEELLLSHTNVADLSPLADMQVKTLEIGGTAVTDLSPLVGTPIEVLRIDDTEIEDLSVLKDMPRLKDIRITHDEDTATYLHKLIPGVVIRHGVPAHNYTTLEGRGIKGPFLMKQGASAKRDSQIERVLDRLLDLNPTMNFGECECDIRDGKVVRFETHDCTDLSPISELTDLEDLQIHGNGSEIDLKLFSELKNLHTLAVDNAHLKNLSDIKDLKLSVLYMWGWGRGETNRDSDFANLSEMPLTRINLGYSALSDFEALKGKEIEFLCANMTKVHDLSPLRGMPIKDLQLGHTRVQDLSPLEGMPLEKLWIDDTGVWDLSPIKGMPIRELGVMNLVIKDRSIIETLPIESLKMNCDPQKDHDWIASLSKLKRLNDRPVEEFLAKYKD